MVFNNGKSLGKKKIDGPDYLGNLAYLYGIPYDSAIHC